MLNDMMILWKQLGERDVAPDICVVKGVRDREAIDESCDPVVEGTGPCLVFEVVSESTRDVQAKNAKENPPLFEKMGVEDLVLVYPRRPAKKAEQKLRLKAKRLDATGRYRTNHPASNGWILLRSVGLRIKVAEDGTRLVVEDVRTGERLLTSVEEEAARRAAEARVEQEAEARQKAEERARQEAAARQKEAAARQKEAAARQKAETRLEQNLRRSVEDLCAVLGIAWDAEHDTRVESMSVSQLEALQTHLVSKKSWPESFSGA